MCSSNYKSYALLDVTSEFSQCMSRGHTINLDLVNYLELVFPSTGHSLMAVFVVHPTTYYSEQSVIAVVAELTMLL